MTMFNSPCTDHRTCTFDIKRLRADTKPAVLSNEFTAITALLASLDEKVKKALIEKSPDLKALQEEQRLTSGRRWFLNALCMNTEAKTFICALKAHHRGRLHGAKRRLPDGTKIEWTLETQAAYLATGCLGSWKVFSYVEALMTRYAKLPAVDAKVA